MRECKSISAPNPGARKSRWQVAWDRFQALYDQADQFVLDVRKGKRKLDDPNVVIGLLDRYGYFKMADDVLAFGATMGLIELMLGPRFGKRREFNSNVFVTRFCSMFQSSGGLDTLGVDIRGATGGNGNNGEDSQTETTIPKTVPIRGSAQRSVASAAKLKSSTLPSKERREALVEQNMLWIDDVNLEIKSVQAKVLSSAGVRLTLRFIWRAILKIKERKMKEGVHRVREEERRAMIESGELTLPLFPETSLPIDPCIDGVVDSADEYEDYEAGDEYDEPGDIDKLLAELEVPVEDLKRRRRATKKAGKKPAGRRLVSGHGSGAASSRRPQLGQVKRPNFATLQRGEFPEPTGSFREFVLAQVETIPHGMSLNEVGREIHRRAGLAGRQTTNGSASQAFRKLTQKKPALVGQLEMVNVQYVPKTGRYIVTARDGQPTITIRAKGRSSSSAPTPAAQEVATAPVGAEAPAPEFLQELCNQLLFVAGAAARTEHARLEGRVKLLLAENDRLRSLLRQQGEALIAAAQSR